MSAKCLYGSVLHTAFIIHAKLCAEVDACVSVTSEFVSFECHNKIQKCTKLNIAM